MRWSRLSLVDSHLSGRRSHPESSRIRYNFGTGLHFRVTLFRSSTLRVVMRCTATHEMTQLAYWGLHGLLWGVRRYCGENDAIRIKLPMVIYFTSYTSIS